MALSFACGGPRASTDSAAEMRDAGITAYRSGDLIEALRRLRDATARDPMDSLTHAYLARSYRNGGWEAEGYEHFREISSRLAETDERDRAPALGYYLAAFAAYTGQLDSARVHVQRARGVRPPSELEASMAAESLLLSGERDLGVLLLAMRARGEEGKVEEAVDLARALWRAGRASEAYAEAERLLSEYPTHARVLATAALARFAQGDLEGSEALTRRWLRAAPADPDALWNLTRIAVSLDRWGAADTLLSTIVAGGR